MTQNKKIEGQALLDIIRAILPSTRLTLKDLWRSLTKDNIRDIRDAIREQKSPDTIEALLHSEKSISILKMLLAQPVLDPEKKIPEGTSYKEVLKSKFPFIGRYLTKMTTLYETCTRKYIENRNEGHDEKAEHYKEVFKFLLEQRQPKENFAELVVKLVDYARYNPDSACELLDVMEKHEYKDKQGKNHRIIDKINFNQNVFIPYRPQESIERSDVKSSNVSKSSVSSSSSQKSGLLSLFERFGVLYHQPAQTNGVTMSLKEFLSSVSEVSGNEKIAAFTKAIMPSKSVDSPNPTQHVTQPKQL
ncbi:hypothetical protein [Wolbachia endosymbiont of Folsomia candida]|uniref:hypothetical protein n=1 Tax=Wolbachia endosymbiont of Folsomia candida TaxID=169402 RepID=UPI000AC93248|nr:hypothetical protein [Wolbachia endosymbiont of Folsomia candida]APR98536.1 hypothetical protein ASM33_04720 [Wolbachia endosymbiont of Folsomia candida]